MLNSVAAIAVLYCWYKIVGYKRIIKFKGSRRLINFTFNGVTSMMITHIIQQR